MWRMRSSTDLEDDFVEEFRGLSKRKRELEFIEQATNGDTDRVSAILKNFPDLNKDCVDQKGRTALRIAIRRQQTPVVETLLDVSSAENVYAALLLSIDQDNDDVSELIISHPTYRSYSKEKQKQIEKGVESDAKEDETLFSHDVTPLMLAAQKEQTYIVQLLLELDERIEVPHKYDCPCNDCQAVDNGESLKTARARLNAYRGLCSRAYILQTSKDPILRAFALCDKTEWLSTQEKHFKKEYKQLKEQLGELVTKLLDRVRTEEELDELLHEVAGAQQDEVDPEEGVASKEFTRLNLALYREQKTFVSHPYCQRKLMSLWYGKQSFQQKGQSLPETLVKSFYLMLLYPVLAVLYWLMPTSKIGVQVSAPIIKFTATVFSYLVFLCLIVAYSVIKTPTAGVTLSEHPTIGPHYREYAGISSVQTAGQLRRFQHNFLSRKLQSVDDIDIFSLNSTTEYVTIEENTSDYTGSTTFSAMDTSTTDQETTPSRTTQSTSTEVSTVQSTSEVLTTQPTSTETTEQTTIGRATTSPAAPTTTATISTTKAQFQTTTVPQEITESTTEDGNSTDPDLIADVMIRYHTVDALSIVICIWVIGYLVHDLKEVYSEPLGYYLASYFNIMDICLITFYITSFTLRFVTIGKVQSAVNYLSKPEAWQNFQNAQIMNTDEALHHLYWINADRFYWDTFDPFIFCEALFAVANILIICRLAGLLIVNEAMGPLIISLGRMLDDIVRFMILFGLVFFAYIIGFLNLYWYYFPDTRSEAEVIEHDLQVNAGEAFGEIEGTFTTTFWSLFGMVDPDSVEIDEAYAISEVTNRVGYILFGVYNVMAVIVFINILIAMMSSSFEHVLESEDMEWKFARTNLYIDFLRGGNVLPIPLNLIPTPLSVYDFFRYTLCGTCCGPKKPKENGAATDAANGIEMSTPGTSQNVYETPPNSESGISSDQGEGTSSHGSLENPKMADIQTTEGMEEEGEEEEEEEHANIYSDPVDTEELWRVRGQLKPEPEPSSAYAAVMEKLVHRYFNLGQSTDEAGNEQDGNAASTDKLKNELDSLRNELRMTTFRLKKDLNSLRKDTKSHLVKVEQQCDDVSQQCTVVSKQCNDVSVQCNSIHIALNQLFSEMSNLTKSVAELKAIASKPIYLPQASFSQESSAQVNPALLEAKKSKKEKTGTSVAPKSTEDKSKRSMPSNLVSRAPEPGSSGTASQSASGLELSDQSNVEAAITEKQTESLMATLPKVLSSLFSGTEKPGPSAHEEKLQKSDAQPQQAARTPKGRLTSKTPTSGGKSKTKKDKTPSDLIVNPMLEYAIQPPIQQFVLLREVLPQRHPVENLDAGEHVSDTESNMAWLQTLPRNESPDHHSHSDV